MKQILGIDVGTVTFTHGVAGAGTLVFTAIPRFSPSRLMGVSNITRKTLMYAAEIAGKSGVWSSVDFYGGTLTLDANTNGHDDADLLRCLYEHEDLPEPGFHKELIESEGFRFSTGAIYNGPWPAAQTNIGFMGGPGVGQARYLNTITLSASRPIRFNFYTPRSDDDGSANPYYGMEAFVKDAVVFHINTIFCHGDAGNLNIAGGDGASVSVVTFANGWRLCGDTNFSAKRIMLWIGDSIPETGPGSAISTTESDIYTFKARNYIRDTLGKDYRMVVRSLGGTGAADAAKWQQRGAMDTMCPKRVNMLFYQMGVNDSGDAAAALTATTGFVERALARFPYATIVVLGPSPVENNAKHAALETIRANHAALAAANQPRVQYCNLGDAFDRTDASFYATSDTAGNRVHPSFTGHAALGTVITTWLAANARYIP
jgi:hypothetical protein